MRIISHIIPIISLLIAIVSSCEHKELCYDHSHVMEIDVVFDWANAPDAAPKSMSLYLFPENGGSPIRYDLVGHKGGRIRLNTGTYHAICLNSDTENIIVNDDFSQESTIVRTKDAGSSAGVQPIRTRADKLDNDEERIVLPPELIWSSSGENIYLSEESNTLTLYPELRVTTCTVEIRNTDNLQWVENIYGTLSSMADGYFPDDNVLSEGLATIIFRCRYDVESARIMAELSTFGHCPTGSNKHILTINATLADGNEWQYTTDVTDQIHDSDEEQNITIMLEKLPIPKPVVNGGGFKPTVDEWSKVDINIDM